MPRKVASRIHYLKVTTICRYIFFLNTVHFTGIKFCYFEKCDDNRIIILQLPVQ